MILNASGGPAPSKRIAALDGLRGLAILLVLAVHYYAIPPISAGFPILEWLRRVAGVGFTGVDLFFVLSGFLIGGIVLDHATSPRLLRAFYARRFWRIVPIYGLLLASFLVARSVPGLRTVNYGTYFNSTLPTWTYFVFGQNFAMAWLQDIGPYWLGVTWSLAVEEQFYLAMPWIVRRLSRRAVVGTCVAVILLSPLLRLGAQYYAHNPYVVLFLLFTRADGLMWGVLCACLVREEEMMRRLRHRGWILGSVILAGAVAFGAIACGGFGAASVAMFGWGYSTVSAWFAALVLGVVAFPAHRLSRWLGWKPLAKVGVTSYFIYLFHTPIWYVGHWVFFRHPPLHLHWREGVVTVMSLLVTLLAAGLSWRWLEQPLLKRGRRFPYA